MIAATATIIRCFFVLPDKGISAVSPGAHLRRAAVDAGGLACRNDKKRGRCKMRILTRLHFSTKAEKTERAWKDCHKSLGFLYSKAGIDP